MRISDWSSDVCSSDLGDGRNLDDASETRQNHALCRTVRIHGMRRSFHGRIPGAGATHVETCSCRAAGFPNAMAARLEERRVGTECVGTGYSRVLPSHQTKQQNYLSSHSIPYTT